MLEPRAWGDSREEELKDKNRTPELSVREGYEREELESEN